MADNLMEKIVALCKRRGFIFPGSEIYGGLGGTWDYGPLGVELKNNIKNEWWKSMVYGREDVVGIDAAIMMNSQIWVASGHVEAFSDPLIECEICHKRFRPDKLGFKPVEVQGKIIGYSNIDVNCPSGNHKLKVILKQQKDIDKEKIIYPWQFNLLVTAQLGVVEKQNIYLRGEITQGVFVNFKNVLDSTRIKIAFGIAQIGKAFRNEITPGNFTYRSREFEQMELEFFIKNNNQEGNKWFNYWKEQRINWYVSLGIKKENLRFRKHEEHEKAHYTKFAEDIEYNAPFGWSELEGIHHRGDWDLSRHKLTYKEENGEEYAPWVIETSGGVDRSALFFLIDAYQEEKDRILLKLHPRLSPVKVAVFPLLANKKELIKMTKDIYLTLKKKINGLIHFDDRGNIGKRYFAQDEIGTPFCVTIDFQSLENKTVTVRDRDTTKQERVKIENLVDFFQKKLN